MIGDNGQSALSARHKEAVKSWIPKVRNALEKDLSGQLARLGIRSGGESTPLSEMNLPDTAGTNRLQIEALLERETMAESSAERGYASVLRELTYTMLNRLLGLKAMETRGLLFLPNPKTGELEQTEVLTPVPGQARSRYLRDFRAAGGTHLKYDADSDEILLREGLAAAFLHITGEIRLLFDPDHEYACVWPTHACLATVIDMINRDLPEDAYRAQDFLGWVYQFFNRAEKERVRKETKGTPRTSYELSVINQFYTPSWVVKALVDNTLGRLWLQMHQDSTLKANQPVPLPEERVSDDPVADYLVPRTGEKIPFRIVTEEGQVQDFKQVKDISLLDPACGTMHFGQYAFGLFVQMYLDEIQHAGEEGWPTKPSVSDLKDIPVAIIENNLFGIDIDARAIQIAALSLFLTAKEAAVKLGYSSHEVSIHRTNLVVANAVNLGKEKLKHLVSSVSGKIGSARLQEHLFSAIWENLQNVGELGSLIQVREGVTEVLDSWVQTQARKRGLTKLVQPKAKKQIEFDFEGELKQKHVKQLELERQLLEEEAQQLRQELIASIEDAAMEVSGDTKERIFAEDTARGVKLLQMLSRSYDVVVMNPPYGAFVPKVKAFVRSVYPLTHNDIYASFIDRGTQLVGPHGYVGALVSRTFVAQVSAKKLREQILLKRNPMVLMLDLGPGILDDATVEAAAIVLRGGTQ